jgi:PAS domain S-box-containing protein
MNSLEQSAPRERGLVGWTEALFDAIDDAAFVHDARGNILEANQAACRRLGYSRTELLRLNTADIDDPEFAAGFQERLQAQLTSSAFRCEGRHRTKEGQIIPVDINSSAILFRDRPAVLAVMRDISKQKRAESRREAQYAVARALAGDTIEESAREVLRVMCEVLAGDTAALFVVNSQENHLRCLETWHRPELNIPEFDTMTRRIALPPGVGLAGRVWQSGAPEIHGHADPDSPLPREAVAAREGLQAGLAFPIKSGGETTGVVEFLQRRLTKPDGDVFALTEALASQIGQVLERRRIEKALRDSEALYESLVDCLPQNIFRKDLEGRVTFANKRYCETLKRPPAELIGKTDFDLFPGEMAAKYVCDDNRVLQTGTVLETIEEHRLPEGSLIYVQVVKTPIHDAHGNIIGTQGIFWDVTEKTRAEAAVKESELRYRKLTEATQDGIVVADQTGTITLFNPAAQRMFGYTAAEVLGQPLTVLMAAEFQDLHRRGFQRFLITRQPRIIGRAPVELQARRKDGAEFPIELALSAMTIGPPGPDGQEPVQFLGALRDLTERNRMRAELVRNEKLASIGLLSAGVAHEINNPLAFVANNLVVLERDCQGLLELVTHYEAARTRLAQVDAHAAGQAAALADQIDLPYVRDNLPRLLNRTREGVDRVTRIVQSLRALARTDAPRRQDTHIPDLVETALEIVRGRLRRSAIEVVQEHDPLPRAACVSSQISQVLLNLLVNAIQAIEATGRKSGNITVSTRRFDKELLIQVADNGCGVQPNDLPRIFDPFFTTKDVGEGTGLGLSISHNIITGHGGRFEVDSTPGQGSCFRVYLPLNDHARGKP